MARNELGSKWQALRFCLLALSGTLVSAWTTDLALADKPGLEKSRYAKQLQNNDRRTEQAPSDRSDAPLPWQSKAQYEADVWAFCQQQRRVCINACATFFRGRPNCTQTCSNTAHSCAETACFEWKPTHWRVVSRSGGRICID